MALKMESVNTSQKGAKSSHVLPIVDNLAIDFSPFEVEAKVPRQNQFSEKSSAGFFRAGENTFVFHSRTCQCTAGTPGSYCAVLEYLGLSWVASEKLFGCIEHKCLVLFGDIPSHLKTFHTSLVGKLSKSPGIGLPYLVAHLARIFPVNQLQSASDLQLHLERSDAIELLACPERAMQCPTCFAWMKVRNKEGEENKNFRRHFTRQKASSSGSVQPCSRPSKDYIPVTRWTQIVFHRSVDPTSFSKIVMPAVWEPQIAPKPLAMDPDVEEPFDEHRFQAPPLSTLPIRPNLPSANIIPSYIERVRYNAWLSRIEADPADLVSLISPPKKLCDSMSVVERVLESRLPLVSNFGKEYIVDSSHFANTASEQVRDAVTMDSRSVFKSDLVCTTKIDTGKQ